MNLDAIFRAANENTDPDPRERDFEELMANALRVCLDDLLANRGPGYGDPALPMMRTPSKAEPAEATKMPQVTPEMLERLRKRIAGEK